MRVARVRPFSRRLKFYPARICDKAVSASRAVYIVAARGTPREFVSQPGLLARAPDVTAGAAHRRPRWNALTGPSRRSIPDTCACQI